VSISSPAAAGALISSPFVSSYVQPAESKVSLFVLVNVQTYSAFVAAFLNEVADLILIVPAVVKATFGLIQKVSGPLSPLAAVFGPEVSVSY
jgi:hypothetical protein